MTFNILEIADISPDKFLPLSFPDSKDRQSFEGVGCRSAALALHPDMIYAPAAAAQALRSETTAPWSVENMTDAQCVQGLLGGDEGDFLVRTTDIETQPFTMFLRIAGVPDNIKHVGILCPDGKVHNGLVKLFDSENKRVVVQWSEDDGVLRSETLRDRDIVTVNPRASIRIERIKVMRTHGQLHLSDVAEPRFDTIDDLIYHYQHNQRITLHLHGEDVSVALNAVCKAWVALGRQSAPPPVVQDLKIPSAMTRAECEAALAADGCETGDFVVRLADAREKTSYAYAISVLGAVRVLHIGVARQSNNLFVNVKQPQMQFATLSELVEYGIESRLDGLLLRRAFVPSTANLNSFYDNEGEGECEREVEPPTPQALDDDAPLPWEVLSTPTLGSPLAPPAKFSWAAVMQQGGMQAEIDDIYGMPAARVF